MSTTPRRKPLPSHQVQIDVEFIEPIPGAEAKKLEDELQVLGDDAKRLPVD